MLSKVREEKQYDHERIRLSGFSKSLKNMVPSSQIEIGLNGALAFVVLVQGWDGGHYFRYPTYQSKKEFGDNKKKGLYSLSRAVGHT